MAKHAYLIVANANFWVLRKCLELIDDTRNDVFLLLDKKTKITSDEVLSLENVCKYANVYTTRMIVNWGGYSQIDAVLQLLKIAISKETPYRYFHFFQGSDLPIKSQDHIHAFFEKNDGKEFVMVEKSRTSLATRKTQHWHLFCHNRFFRKNKIMKAMNFGAIGLQKLLGIRKNVGIPVYQGSALFSITDECAVFLLSMEKQIKKMFRWSLAADEVFLQSILMNSSFREHIADIDEPVTSNARLIDRTRPDGKNSPHIWRSDEFNYIANQPDSICFARKFDESLDREIAEKIFCHIKGGF